MTTVEYMLLLVKQYGSEIPQAELERAINFEAMLTQTAFNNGKVSAQDQIKQML